MEHAELAVEREDRLDGTIDVLDRAPARREEHRLAEGSHIPEEGHVQQIPRGELEGIDVQLGQEVGARLVERGRDERDAFLPRVAAELEPFAPPELERLAVLAVGRSEAVLVVVRDS